MIQFSSHIYLYSDSRPIDFIKPDEDYGTVQGNNFAAFDGVTLLFQNPYPDPSPAYVLAKEGVEEAFKTLQNTGNAITNEVIHESFKIINDYARNLNEANGVTPQTVNHLDYQYAAVVGALGILQNDILYCGQINDCGVLVLDPQGNKLLDLIANTENHAEYLNYVRQTQNFQTGEAEHQFWRSNVVNQNIDFNGKPVEFGVLNGEINAQQFVKTANVRVYEGCLAIFYTDGFLPLILNTTLLNHLQRKNDPELIKSFIENSMVTSSDAYKKEKTMVVVKFHQ